MNDRCTNLETRNEELEQYTRKNSLRFAGLEEKDNEDPSDTILHVCNDFLKVDPPVNISDIDNAHRLGEASPRALIIKFSSYRVRRRVFEVKRRLKRINTARKSGSGGALWSPLESTASDDEGHGDASVADTRSAADGQLRSEDSPSNEQASEDPPNPPPVQKPKLPPIFINEDLTRARNNLLFEARKLKREGKLSDAWSFEGRIRVKNLQNQVEKIDRLADINRYV